MREFSLDGKVAVVIGASRGIGRAIALRFAQAGAKVAVSSRKLEGVQAVADEIEAAGGKALALQAHVGRSDDVAALVTQTVETFDRVDVAVNNAATNPHFGPLLTAGLDIAQHLVVDPDIFQILQLRVTVSDN